MTRCVRQRRGKVAEALRCETRHHHQPQFQPRRPQIDRPATRRRLAGETVQHRLARPMVGQIGTVIVTQRAEDLAKSRSAVDHADLRRRREHERRHLGVAIQQRLRRAAGERRRRPQLERT